MNTTLPADLSISAESHSNNRLFVNPVNEHWGSFCAKKVIERHPDAAIYTCAAGISPSGMVHFGNFRDIITSLVVALELQRLGKKTRLLFSWDDFDRLRKIPAGVDPSFERFIGHPLAKIPDPEGAFPSWARRFEDEFERSLADLGITIEFRYQSKEYQSGSYASQIIHAMKNRTAIADLLLSFMSDKGKESKGIDPDQYRADFYPLSIYSRFTGSDKTKVVHYDGEATVTYRCIDTKKEDTINLNVDHCCKLPWKIDWAMRWKYEGVTFEPGGKDHAAPGGSYDTSSQIAKQIFNYEPPIFVGYEFVGLQGLGGKMSGSSGNAVTPAQLLEIYEPDLLRWLYLRRSPEQTFSLSFDSEIIRQYDEFDREVLEHSQSKLDPVRSQSLELSKCPGSELSVRPASFRQLLGLAQIAQWNEQRTIELFEKSGTPVDPRSVASRLRRAKRWIEKYNPEQAIQLRDTPNTEYWQTMSDQAREYIRALVRIISERPTIEIGEIESLVYQIPKDESLEQKENAKRQRAFFKDVYHLLLSSDTGPRLSTFLWAVDRTKVLGLLRDLA